MIDSIVLTQEEICKIISKSESMNYCVFIMPGYIDERDKIINNLCLKCSIKDIEARHLLLELYDNKEDAMNRMIEFNKKEWQQLFYVPLYKNGKIICKNM